MAESFRCPSCSAPLKFKGTMVQTCKFCNSDVIVPSGLVKPEEKVFEPEPPMKDESLINASELGQKAVRVAEIKRAIKQNKKMSAALLFRDNFGGSLADAIEIIEAIETGKSVSVPGLQSEDSKSERSFPPKWIIFVVIAATVAILLYFFLIFSENLFG